MVMFNSYLKLPEAKFHKLGEFITILTYINKNIFQRGRSTTNQYCFLPT